MADLAPPFPADRPVPGSRWILGECGCEGTVIDGAIWFDDGYTYCIEENDRSCAGDDTKSHWGVRPGLPGVGPTRRGEPA